MFIDSRQAVNSRRQALAASTQVSVQRGPEALSPKLGLMLGKSLFAELDAGHWGCHWGLPRRVTLCLSVLFQSLGPCEDEPIELLEYAEEASRLRSKKVSPPCGSM